MPNQIPLDDMGSVDTTQIELDEMIELDPMKKKKPGLIARGIDVAKEFTAGVADIAKAGEAGYKRRGREAEGEVELGLDMRNLTHAEIKQVGQKSAELRDSGLSHDAQVEQVKSKAFQEAMPKPQYAEGAGFAEQAVRGIVHSGPAMVTTAVNPMAGLVAMFQLVRGGKIDELEQKKANELKGVKDSWHIKEIEDKYSDKKNMDAATLHSILSTPVEQFGTIMEFGILKKMLKSSGAGSRLTEFLKNMSKNSGMEGIEEWIQTHTELIADKFQQNPDQSGGEVWTDIADEFATWKHQGKAGKAFALGVTGAAITMGAPAGAVNIAQSVAQKAAISDLTSDERALLKTNPLLTADDLRNDRGLPKDKVEVSEEGFGSLEEDVENEGVQVTENSTVMNSGLGDRGTIILEERLRTETEMNDAARAAREQTKARLEADKEQAAVAAQEQAKIEAEQAAEAKAKTEQEAQEMFDMTIASRPGLVNKSIEAVAALENNSDPAIRKAMTPIKKAQQALSVREDNAKRLMTIQNDLRVELKRTTDQRAASLLTRLDEELEFEIDKADAKEIAKEQEKAAKEAEKAKTEPTSKAAATPVPSASAAVAKKPAPSVPKQKYDTYKPHVKEAVATGKKVKAEKTKAALEKASVARKTEAKKLVKGVGDQIRTATSKTAAQTKLAKTKAAIESQKKKHDIKYQFSTKETTAGQVQDNTMVAGIRFGDTVKRVSQGQSVRQTLSKVAKQGKSFYVDVMHPSKIGARIYQQQRKEGVTPEHAKVAVTRLLEKYSPVYEQVSAKYLKVTTPTEQQARTEMAQPAVAVDTAGIRKQVRTSLQRAKVNLKGITGVKVMASDSELKESNPVLYNQMKQTQSLGSVNALFDPNKKEIYVFTDHANSVVKAKQAVWHELGHFSLDQLFGDQLTPVMKLVSEQYESRVKEKMASGYPKPALATEEVLIEMFTNNETNTAVQGFKNLWDRFIQKLGFHKGEINERDVRKLVAQINKNLMAKKVAPKEVKRIQSIANNAWNATMEDVGTENAKYLIDKEKWAVQQDKEEFGTVNNRMQKELEVFEKLFGTSSKSSMMPGKYDTKTGKRPVARTITARAMGEELERVRADGTLKRYLDPTVSPADIVKERGLKDKEKLHFLKELKDLRSGPLYVDDSVKMDKKVISGNDKAGISLDFWLGTCQPTQPCKECYAAKAYFRMSAVKKSFRNTAYILAEPTLWAKKVAKEIKAIPQTKIPFIRLLGSGDMTFSEQVKGFNELAKVADRPIHIFSRHHDNLRQLKGTKAAPFMKMGSVDTQLFDHYGMKYLEENAKLGIANAFLYTDKSELPKINKLIEKDALGLILSADTKLHKTLSQEGQAASCPCDAGERGAFGSCRMCAMGEAGCFMGFAAKGFDNKGKVWDLTDPKKPKGIMPFTMFLRDAQSKPGLPKIVQAYSNIAEDMFSKSMTYTQQQILWFGQKKQVDMKLKDIRFPDQVTRTKDVEVAKAWKANLSLMRDEARKGTFLLPSGDIQPTVEFKEGKEIKYDRMVFKSRRDFAKAKQAELSKFGPPPRLKKKNAFRPGQIAFTKSEQERRVIKQKAQVKSLIIGGIKAGAYTGAVRFAPMADINQIIKDGKITDELHATPILGKDYDAVPAYGDKRHPLLW
jgi:hypothetical protein